VARVLENVSEHQHIGMMWGEISTTAKRDQYTVAVTEGLVIQQGSFSSLLPRFVAHTCDTGAVNCRVRWFLRYDVAAANDCDAVLAFADVVATRNIVAGEILLMGYGWKDMLEQDLVLCFCTKCDGHGIIGKAAPSVDVRAWITERRKIMGLDIAAAPSATQIDEPHSASPNRWPLPIDGNFANSDDEQDDGDEPLHRAGTFPPP
jgi:hypothetical protein